MPIASSSRRSGSSNLPEPRQSILSSLGTGIFELADAPGNMTRSAVRFAQTGDARYLGNIAANIIPGYEAETIDAADITGSDNFAANLATTLLLDPLLPVSSIGKPTQLGRALKEYQTARTHLRTLSALDRVAGSVSKAEELSAAIKATGKAKELVRSTSKLAGKTRTKQSILGIEGIPFVPKSEVLIGDFSRFKQLTDNIRVLPDTRISPLQQKLVKLNKQLAKKSRDLDVAGPKLASKLTDEIASLDRKIERTTERLEGLDKGILGTIITPAGADKIRNAGKKIKGIFNSKSANEALEINKEVLKSNILRDTFDIGQEEAVIAARVDALRQAALKLNPDETLQQFRNRMIAGAEARHVIPPNVQELFQSDVNAIKKKFVERLKKEKSLETKGVPFDKAKFKAAFENQIFKAKLQAEHRLLNTKATAAKRGALQQEEMELNKYYFDDLQSYIEPLQKLGYNITELQSSKGFLSYVPRIFTKEAIQLKKTDPLKYASTGRQFQVMLDAAKRRRLYPEEDIPTINKLLRQDFNIDFDVFDTDIARLITESRLNLNIATHKAAHINIAAETLGRTKRTFKSDVPFHPVGRNKGLWAKLGLDPEKAPKKWLPKTLADDILGTDRFFLRENDEKGLIRQSLSVIDRISNVWRVGLTTLFPGFHFRNLVNNTAMNMLARDVHVDDYMEMLRLQRLAAKRELKGKDLETWRQLHQWGAVRGGEIDSYADYINKSSVQKILERPFKGSADVLFEKLGKTVAPRVREEVDYLPMGRAFGRLVEDNARGAHFLGKMRAGGTPLQASRSMKRYLFDYSELTKTEKEVIGPLFLFYAWMRKNIPLQLKTAITNPRYVSIYSKITGLGEDDVPDYLRGGFAFKGPESILGRNAYIGSLGLGLEDLFLFNVAQADPSANLFASADEVKRLRNNFFSRLAPALKIPAEIFAGEEFFSGKSFSRLDLGDYLQRVLPTSRFGSTYKNIVDDDKSFTSKLVDISTGLRIYTIDNKRKISESRRRALASGRVVKLPILIPADKNDETAKRLIKKFREELKKANE